VFSAAIHRYEMHESPLQNDDHAGERPSANLMLLGVLALVVVLLPFAGAVLAGKPAARYLEFPPTTRYVTHADFSLPAFLGVTLFGAAVVAALAAMGFRTRGRGDPPPPAAKPFPWWGWLGLVTGALFWCLAWTRFPWFAAFQAHTFFPLWMSYIVVVNAVTWRRTGRCMMTHDTAYFLILFPFSAAFWWLFEVLNRFVQNWYYSGADYGPATYFALATVSFSTVLPAVLGTRDCLLSTRWLGGGFTGLPGWAPPRPRMWLAAVLLMTLGSLAGIGIWPDRLFPFLWVSPLLLTVCLRQWMGKPHPLTPIACGEWRPVVAAAAAALVCGWFWEMWNLFSLAKWIYSVPYVQAAHIFEMPLPGYAGYLPFGLECAAVGMLLKPPAGR
jgi:hypothetical protein